MLQPEGAGTVCERVWGVFFFALFGENDFPLENTSKSTDVSGLVGPYSVGGLAWCFAWGGGEAPLPPYMGSRPEGPANIYFKGEEWFSNHKVSICYLG